MEEAEGCVSLGQDLGGRVIRLSHVTRIQVLSCKEGDGPQKACMALPLPSLFYLCGIYKSSMLVILVKYQAVRKAVKVGAHFSALNKESVTQWEA